MGRWEREESDLITVGPKTANSGSTGQTGSPILVRPVRANLPAEVFGLGFDRAKLL